MPRNVFFSFHHKRDIIRVSRIRNCGTFTDEGQPFLDKAEWEKIKSTGDAKIKNWIDAQMERTSVLIACIGNEYLLKTGSKFIYQVFFQPTIGKRIMEKQILKDGLKRLQKKWDVNLKTLWHQN